MDSRFGDNLYGDRAAEAKWLSKVRSYAIFGATLLLVAFGGLAGLVELVALFTLVTIVSGVKTFEFLLTDHW